MNQEFLKKAKYYFYIALGIDIIVNLTNVFISLNTNSLIRDLNLGNIELNQNIIDNLNYALFSYWGSILTTFFVGVALLNWLYASYSFCKNTLGLIGLKHVNWITLGWIIPFFNLFKPYQVISDIYKAGSSSENNQKNWVDGRGSPLLLFWWVIWVIIHLSIASFGKNIVYPYSSNDYSDIGNGLIFAVILSIFAVTLSGLWFIVVENLTNRLITKSKKILNSNGQLDESINLNSVLVDQIKSPENYHYSLAVDEYESDKRDKGLWAKCFALSNGDENATKSMYIRERAETIAKSAM